LKRIIDTTTIVIVIGNPTRKEDQRRREQRSAASATASGQSPRHNNQRPQNASNIPRITKKIDIVSAINIDRVLLTFSDKGQLLKR
jgi:hypothetical protein